MAISILLAVGMLLIMGFMKNVDSDDNGGAL